MFKVGDVFTHTDYKGMKFIVKNITQAGPDSPLLVWAVDFKHQGELTRRFTKLYCMTLVSRLIRYLNKEAVCTK